MPTHEHKHLYTIKCAVCFYVWFSASVAAAKNSPPQQQILRIRIKWPGLSDTNRKNKNENWH